MKTLKYLLMLSICGGLIFVSCTKEEQNVIKDIENYEIEDEVNAETFAEDLGSVIDDELDFADVFFDSGDNKDGQEKGPTTRADVNEGCATRTASAERGTWPNTVTITLGEGCKGRHGQNIRGEIVVTLSDNPRTTDATRTITLNDFQIGDVTINGTRTVTNMGRDDNQRRQLNRTEDLTITRGDDIVKRRSNITTTRMAGDDTDTREDDSLERTGTVEGTNRKGETYTTEITSAIVRKGNCRWPVCGTKVVTRGDRQFTINYSDSIDDDCDDAACDNIVYVTHNDKTREFTIGG